jgi:DNA gyrase subunit A
MPDDETPQPPDPEVEPTADDATPPTALTFGTIEPIEIQTEMEQSFLDYAMSVIVSRALPDVRDGLKPVHRRILWAMHDTGLRPDRSHRKCATVIGEVIGKYHPHGDQAVYFALVRMGQDFSLRHVLIDKHGNFGSPDDEPAAYRYTECRLSSLATHLLADIDEDTVDFTPNFDGSTEEPEVLPARFPNLLVNGGQGIAVGMATNIPPHNLGEVVDATIHLIDHPDATVEDLMQFVQGPDFPTGGQILGRAGILDAFRTGRGSIRMRAAAEIVDGPRGQQIVVTEIPYQTSFGAIETKAAELVNAKVIEGIRAIRNESARGANRLVFDLKRDAPALVILNNLYKHTPMQSSFGVNMVALVDGVPRTLSLREALVHYVEHQVEVIRRRSEYRLAKARDRAHIVEGLLKAIDMIDAIIATIRASDDKPAAHAALMAEPFEFSDAQANHILDMTLARLTRLGRTNLEEELAKLRETIAELEAILADDAVLRGCDQGRAGGDPRRVRDATALPDRLRPGRPRRGGPHRRRGARRDDDGQRLHQDGVGRRLPHPGTRRARGGRHEAEGRGLRHRHHPHVGPRVPAAVLEPRPRLPAEGPPDPDGRADRPGHGPGEPPAAPARGARPGDHRHPRLRDEPVPVLRHP